MAFAPPRPQSVYGRPGAAQGIVADIDWGLATKVGEHYGGAFKGLGATAGKAIEQYGLNKRKRAVLEKSLQGKVSALMEHDPKAAKDLFRDESFNKDTERLMTGEMGLSDLEGLVGKIEGYSGVATDALSRDLALSQGRMAKVDAGIAERDKAALSGFAKTLAELQVKRVTVTNQAEIDRILALAESAGLDRDLLKKTVDDRVSILKSQADTAGVGARIAKDTEKDVRKQKRLQTKEMKQGLRLQAQQIAAQKLRNKRDKKLFPNQQRLLQAEVDLIPTKKDIAELDLRKRELAFDFAEATEDKERELLGLKLESAHVALRLGKAQAGKLEAELDGKSVPLRAIIDPRTGVAIPDQFFDPDGEMYDLSSGKAVKVGTIRETDTPLEIATKGLKYWNDQVDNLGEGTHMFTATDYEWADEELNWSVQTYDMVVTQGTEQDDGTWDHAWTDASGELRRVEGWKSLEDLRDGTTAEKKMADKLEAYRKAVRNRNKMPSMPSTPSPQGGGSIQTTLQNAQTAIRNAFGVGTAP